jgi:hypothetical protein
MAPRRVTTMPRGYLLEAAWREVAGTLQDHSITVRRLNAPFEAEVAQFHIHDVTRTKAPYQGQFPLESVAGEWETVTRSFPAGTYWIPMDQPAGLLAMQLLEPEADNSLLAWNAFDTIFERGIVRDRWALEQLALDLLEDAETRAAYEAALADSAFADDPQAKLDFFFARTRFEEERYRRYPVVRLMGPAPIHFWP